MLHWRHSGEELCPKPNIRLTPPHLGGVSHSKAPATQQRPRAWTTPSGGAGIHDPIRAAKLPDRPAVVYACYDQDDEIIYIGATVDLRRRTSELARRQPWWSEVARIVEFPFDRLADARAREAVAISTVRPRHNAQHKHDTDGAWTTPGSGRQYFPQTV